MAVTGTRKMADVMNISNIHAVGKRQKHQMQVLRDFFTTSHKHTGNAVTGY